MASEIQAVDKGNSEEMTPSTSKESSTNAVFMPKDTLDQPCDIVLVVEDGKQFKAHRKVLSEASPFFEKLLNSDMKESKEGIVRLEMFSESVMAVTLTFIYTDHVLKLTEDNAQDLIALADYLFLPRLKALAEEVLTQKLDLSNCISTYYVSERYKCEELLSKSKKFILANFTAVYAANREDVLNMSKKEVEMLISSDEIDVSAEEDVFKIILAWIDHDKDKRKKYFAELFCQVRLVYVSRDFLNSDVVTNDLVKENEGCLDLVRDAMFLIDSRRLDNLPSPPRKPLQSSAIIMHEGAGFLYYFPDEDSWCRLGEVPSTLEYQNRRYYEFFPCEGKLYEIVFPRIQHSLKVDMLSYNPYTSSCTQLPLLDKKHFWKIFVRNEDEMWALLCDTCRGSRFVKDYEKEHSLFISKYNPLSHSWQDVASFNDFHPSEREGFCIVASDNFIYFIGGLGFLPEHPCYLSDVDRYDLSKGQWEKVADIQVARRSCIQGAAANGKVFIAGRDYCNEGLCDPQCEMYDETTNEWQFIASFKLKLGEIFDTLLAADGNLYAVSSMRITKWLDSSPGSPRVAENWRRISVDHYNHEKNDWERKTQKEFPYSGFRVTACPIRIFKGLFNFHSQETVTAESLSTQASSSRQKVRKQKCLIA